jgi:hypothetical protein
MTRFVGIAPGKNHRRWVVDAYRRDATIPPGHCLPADPAGSRLRQERDP